MLKWEKNIIVNDEIGFCGLDIFYGRYFFKNCLSKRETPGWEYHGVNWHSIGSIGVLVVNWHWIVVKYEYLSHDREKERHWRNKDNVHNLIIIFSVFIK